MAICHKDYRSGHSTRRSEYGLVSDGDAPLRAMGILRASRMHDKHDALSITSETNVPTNNTPSTQTVVLPIEHYSKLIIVGVGICTFFNRPDCNNATRSYISPYHVWQMLYSSALTPPSCGRKINSTSNFGHQTPSS